MVPFIALLEAQKELLSPATPELISQLLDSSPAFPCVQVRNLEHTRQGRTTFDFNVRRCLGVRGSKESGSLKLFTVNGRLLMIVSHSQRYVHRDSSSSWAPFFSSVANYERCEFDVPKFLPVTVVLW